jgi:hypothetical protein
VNKPEKADLHNWNKFVEWAIRNSIDVEGHPDVWMIWWECWKAGYNAAMNA